MNASSFALELWRFCTDPRVEGTALIEPMHEAVRCEVANSPGVLQAIHDWSTLSFGGHPSKTDRATLTHAHDVGYDLATVLMARGDDGAPITPVLVSLTTADGVLSTRDETPPADICHIDQILPDMQYVRGLAFAATVVHVIDREADSVNHWRQWSADGHQALVRADDRRVLFEGQETSLCTIAEGLHGDDAFKEAGTSLYHGRKARLFVAEVEVVLHRPGRRNQGKRQVEIPGPPLPLRLVVTVVRDLKGKVPARRLLLTNVPAESADPATIARWFYFRWRIELNLRSLKMQIEMLRTKTPEMVRKEIGMYFLAYNLIRGTMAEAAKGEEIEPRKLSFQGALHTIRAFEESQLYEVTRIAGDLPRLMELIGRKRVGARPDRYEPRAVKRRPKPHPLLRMSRREPQNLIRAGQIPQTKG